MQFEGSNYLCEGIQKQREGSGEQPLELREYLPGMFEFDLKGPVELVRQRRGRRSFEVEGRAHENAM